MTSWYDVARREYVAQRSLRPLSAVLAGHMYHGVVWSGPKSFALARPVYSVWDSTLLDDPFMVAAVDADAWWIYLLAGDWKDAASHLPYELEYIGWERHGRQRWHRMKTVVNLAFREQSMAELLENGR